jgi:methionyl-tRNA formyltransferase
VIGTGTIACGCLESVLEFTHEVTAVEPERHSFSLVRPACQRHGIDYRLITERSELGHFFQSIEARTLVISAHNAYLFPAKVLENQRLNIVNWHNSRLPRHPGRNAPTWAIFEMDDRAGITWHQVSYGIDQGTILIQKEIPVGQKITALELTKRCAELGVAAFREILPQLLRNEYQTTPQPHDPEARLHRSTEVPNDGQLDLAWTVEKVSAFLRSMDYGKLPIMPQPRVRLLGNEYTVKSYSIDFHPNTAEDDLGVFFRHGRMLVRNPAITVHIVLK